MMANRSDFCESLGRGSWDCWSKLPPKTKKNRVRQFASVCTLVSLYCCCLRVACCAKTKILFLRLRSCARAFHFLHPPPSGLILGDVDKILNFFLNRTAVDQIREFLAAWYGYARVTAPVTTLILVRQENPSLPLAAGVNRTCNFPNARRYKHGVVILGLFVFVAKIWFYLCATWQKSTHNHNGVACFDIYCLIPVGILTVTCCRSSWICICSCWSCEGCGAPPRRTLDSCCSNSAMGSTDSRPEGDSADRPPPDELKCILERLERGPPRARPECGIRRTPPCRIADGSSYYNWLRKIVLKMLKEILFAKRNMTL